MIFIRQAHSLLGDNMAEYPPRMGESRTLLLALGAFFGVIATHLLIHAVRRS